MTFHERWFAGPKQRRLTEELERVTATQGSIVEVGSWEGRSTIQIAQHFMPAQVHVIDHWLSDTSNDRAAQAAREITEGRDVFGDFRANCQDAGVWEQIVVHRMDWRDAPWATLAPIRFIFIDGEHTYQQVMDNLGVVVPLMAPGGVIAGDDWTEKGVPEAVRSHFTDDAINRCKGPGAAIWGVHLD